MTCFALKWAIGFFQFSHLAMESSSFLTSARKCGFKRNPDFNKMNANAAKQRWQKRFQCYRERIPGRHRDQTHTWTLPVWDHPPVLAALPPGGEYHPGDCTTRQTDREGDRDRQTGRETALSKQPFSLGSTQEESGFCTDTWTFRTHTHRHVRTLTHTQQYYSVRKQGYRQTIQGLQKWNRFFSEGSRHPCTIHTHTLTHTLTHTHYSCPSYSKPWG